LKPSLDDVMKLFERYDGLPERLAREGSRLASIVFASYLIASSITASSVKFLSGSIVASGRATTAASSQTIIDFSNDINHRELRKIVLTRNVFNSAGEVPSDSEQSQKGDDREVKFDDKAPCRKTALNIELVGTIYMGPGPDSLATVREKGYNEVDVYRAGESIVGQTQAKVYRVERERVVINNAGAKECLELAPPKLPQLLEMQQGQGGVASVPVPVASGAPAAEGMPGADASHFRLEAAFVEQSLGPGFARILESGRLVPHHKDNQMVGFKLIGVKAESLWRRVNLNSGDVITSVNDISMARPDQGFALYQALQDSREIRIEVLKGGATPATYTVEIK